MPIKLFIADDHEIFRNGLRAFLEKEKDIEIVNESGDGYETIKLVSEEEVDVLILDISMPGPPAEEVVEKILKMKPQLAIVILTMHEDEYYLQEMLKKGVRAYVLKKSSGTNLINAINETFKGNHFIDPSLSNYVVSLYTGQPVKKDSMTNYLSKREQEVLKFLVLGYTNSEIAVKLFISKRTVESHKTNIMKKLGLKNKAELVRFAIDNGLIK